MDLTELHARLGPFVRAKMGDPHAAVTRVWKMPGHAGFSYGFTVAVEPGLRSFYLRIPPPNVRWVGTADVLRQATVMRALWSTPVPVPEVLWAGDDLEWFGCPYFVTPLLEGDTLRFGEGGWADQLPPETIADMARQAMEALADLHRLDWEERVPELGPPIPFAEDVTRWDRFLERAAEPEMLRDAPRVRALLLERQPKETRIGIFHGDFQWSNLLYSREGRLLAVIDWELVNIGATLNDLGWIVTFSDPEAWAHEGAGGGGRLPPPDQLVRWYVARYGEEPSDIDWFRALAAYKFAIITGLNLGLHRRGKRPDPHWEVIKDSMPSLLAYALRLLR